MGAPCIGVDGAGPGWLAVWRGTDHLAFARYPDPGTLWQAHSDATVVAVDIPIGLSDSGPRPSDALARDFVGARRASSVFSAPIRPALPAGSRLEASTIQRAIDGRGVAAQAFALYPKIRQWDALLQSDKLARMRVREVHPEVSFAAMRGGRGYGIAEPKRSPEGAAIRADLLAATFGADQIAALRQRVPRRIAAADDVLDALAALWSAERIAEGRAIRLPEPPTVDSAGLTTAIWY